MDQVRLLKNLGGGPQLMQCIEVMGKVAVESQSAEQSVSMPETITYDNPGSSSKGATVPYPV